MKQLSLWAKNHKWTSRILIVASFMLLNILAVLVGILLNDLSVVMPSAILVSAVFIFIICWLIYPLKKDKETRIYQKKFYSIQKLCDFLLAGSTFLMIVFFADRETTPFTLSIQNSSAVNAYSLPVDSSKTYKSIDEFKKMMKDQNGKTLRWKERKKLLKEQIRGIKKAENLSEGGKAVLIILSVLLALVLVYLVAALSCSLSCSGAEGAAVIVAILGIGGVVVLSYFLIRGIVRKSKKDKAKEVKPNVAPVTN